jgi:hypothetical protein
MVRVKLPRGLLAPLSNDLWTAGVPPLYVIFVVGGVA